MEGNYEKEEIAKWIDSLSKVKGKNEGLSKALARYAAMPKRIRVNVNLKKISQHSKENENIVVPGKVLGTGDMEKAVNICAIEYSSSAVEKLKQKGCKMLNIDEMIKKDGVRIIT